MGGKASLLLVLGFSLIFLVAGNNFNNLSINSTDNSATYYDNQVIDNIANSGINFAISSIRRNPNWLPDSSDDKNVGKFNFGGGSFDVKLKKYASLNVLTATAHFQGKSKIVEVKLRMPKFSEFAYFSDRESSGSSKIWWYAKDTVWGPFHTNDNLNCAYKPAFMGSSTTYGKKMNLYSNNHNKHAPHIAGHYENKTIDFPSDGITGLSSMANSGGKVITGQDQVFIEFDGNNIKYKFKESDPYTTELASTFAPNKTIIAKDAELHIKGKVSGNWSIGASGGGTKAVYKTVRRWQRRRWRNVQVLVDQYELGNVYIDDDITYKDNIDFKDRNDPSNDLLGIIAKNDVLITDNSSTKNVNIQAAIFCEDGGFGAENHSSRGKDGQINLMGGVTQKLRGPVGTFSGSNMLSGFNKSYKYDARLQRIAPPSFPDTKQFVVVSWLDTVAPKLTSK